MAVSPPPPALDASGALTTTDLCRRWRCTPRTLQRMARDGRLRPLKLRGGVRYPVEEVLRIERGGNTPSAPTWPQAPEAPSTASPAAGPQLAAVIKRDWYSVCICHRKGGVAKSTTTWYLARELARAGKQVVLRDLDPQQGLRDILRDHGCEDGRYSPTIALVADGAALPFRPDIELIDTPPALDDSLPGVARADAVIVPAMPEHQAVRALERMLLVLRDTRHEHPFVRILGILPVRVKPRWPEHAAFLAQIVALAERFGHPILPAVPESRAVLTYSLRGRLWRPVAEAVLRGLEDAGCSATNGSARGSARG